MNLKTTGIVLREVNYKEADKILTVLTPQGKITAKARGCRRKGSRIAAPSQLFAYSEMELFDHNGRITVNEAETIEIFPGLRKDILTMALASYFAEVTESMTNEEEDSSEILSLVLNSLYAADRGTRDLRIIKSAFEMRILVLSGLSPLTDACVICGRTEPVNARLNVNQGVLHCAACRDSSIEGISIPVSSGTLAAIRYIQNCAAKKLFSFTVSEEALKELSYVAETYLLSQTERGYRTLDFYKSL